MSRSLHDAERKSSAKRGVAAVFSADSIEGDASQYEAQKNVLQPMRTVIGRVQGNYDGIYRDFTVYYGNALSPVLNSKILHLKKERYLEMLDEFLQSEEGKEYGRPSEWQIELDMHKVILEERQIELKREIDLVRESEEEFKAKMESIHSSIASVEEMKKSVDGLETSINASLKKQRIALAAIAVLMAVLVALCAFLALPELSALFTR